MTIWIMLLVSSLNEYRKNMNYNTVSIELSKDFGDKKSELFQLFPTTASNLVAEKQ